MKFWHRQLTLLSAALLTCAAAVRAIKFNLPWSAYRTSPVLEQHREPCQDLKFWEAYLDMMVEDRFNVLSLWAMHSFTYMVRPT